MKFSSTGKFSLSAKNFVAKSSATSTAISAAGLAIRALSDRCVRATEWYLTRRARARARAAERQQKRGFIRDWIHAFLWAAAVVLILNQYFVQGYQIPSGSMIPTLQIGDKVFVNKLVFGPELLPGFARVYTPTAPQRFNVVIFESPEYVSRGVAFEILQRVLYMITLSFVDINRDANGQPRVQFLIKRLVGMPGDVIRYHNGALAYKLRGTSAWLTEDDFRLATGGVFAYPPDDANNQTDMTEMRAWARDWAMRWYSGDAPPRPASYEARMLSSLYARQLLPTAIAPPLSYVEAHNGWYVPPEHFFFMGDNRGDSYDSRFYGPVSERNVLGKAMVIYLPMRRAGSIQ